MSRFNPTSHKSITLTKQQKTIVDSNENTVLVNAVAGSGKTSTLMQLAEKYPKGIYLAFNKAIVKQVISKLPMGWSCKTFNSFGLAIVKQHYPNAKVNFNKYSEYNFNPASALATKHMSLNGNISDDSWKHTCNRFKINYKYIHEAKDLLKQGQENTSEISGDDMLQYPIDNGWKSEHYDIVLVDECQDLNPQQIAFLACIPTNRVIFVGDANQAIYGFRGSDPYALNKIKDMYNPVEYEMTQSFRCPKEILRSVQHIVPNIMSTKLGGGIYRAKTKDTVFPDECFIISRTNNNLIKLAYRFILNNEHFSIGGKFIIQLKKDLNKAFKGCTHLSDMRNNVMRNYKNELTKASNNKWTASDIENKYDSILAIVDMANSTSDIKLFVKNLTLHSDSASCRKLMTIHGAKGLESENVYFVNPESCDYFKGKAETKWEMQQEDNLYYVACTRALNNLTFIN
jgi:superfamily I DNA/RNA helicase